MTTPFKFGTEFLVNTTTTSGQQQPSVTALADGRFVVVFRDDSSSPDDLSGIAVRAQVFNADGSKSGSEFLVNTTTTNSQFEPSVTALADGRFVVVFADFSLSPDDPSGSAVRGQIFDPREAAVSLNGTLVNDDFIGTHFADVLRGSFGDDKLSGAAGDDVIDGEEGNDQLTGGSGNDRISGGAGNDTLFGGGGDDTIAGDAGDDSIDSGDGDNVITGGSGNDTISGGTGIDQLQGGSGNDTLDGGDGADVLYGDADDAGVGTQGNDTIDGGAGNDQIVGGGGADTLDGGDGDDQIFGDGDTIAAAEQGDDVLVGGAGNDELLGYGGADVLAGGDGDDTLEGGAGDDTLDGGAGADQLLGGEGSDTYLFSAGHGADTLTEYGDAADSLDTVEFTGGVDPDSIRVRRDGNDLTLTAAGGADIVRVADYFSSVVTGVGIEHVVFANGTVWDAVALSERATTGTDTDDTLVGTESADVLRGFAGNDSLDGAGGNDRLEGDVGLDTYVLGWSGGTDTVIDDAAESSIVQLSEGLLFSDLGMTRLGNDLHLSVLDTTSELVLAGYYAQSSNWTVRSATGAQQTLADVLAEIQARAAVATVAQAEQSFIDSARRRFLANLASFGASGNISVSNQTSDAATIYRVSSTIAGSTSYTFFRSRGLLAAPRITSSICAAVGS